MSASAAWTRTGNSASSKAAATALDAVARFYGNRLINDSSESVYTQTSSLAHLIEFFSTVQMTSAACEFMLLNKFGGHHWRETHYRAHIWQRTCKLGEDVSHEKLLDIRLYLRVTHHNMSKGRCHVEGPKFLRRGGISATKFSYKLTHHTWNIRVKDRVYELQDWQECRLGPRACQCEKERRCRRYRGSEVLVFI